MRFKSSKVKMAELKACLHVDGKIVAFKFECPLTYHQSSTSLATTALMTSIVPIPSATNITSQRSNSGGKMTTGEKAGIGIGAAIVGLSILCGTFYLGVVVHRRSRKTPRYTEDSESGEKPQLDGKPVFGPAVVRELDARRSMQELHANNGYISELAADEPRSRSGEESRSTQSKSETDGRSTDGEDGLISPQTPRHPDETGRLDSPVSPLSDNIEIPILSPSNTGIPGPVRRDTYDDPRLVQNPWAQDDAPIPKASDR
jgi:hypothetical protein